jgi:hypothetical protein
MLDLLEISLPAPDEVTKSNLNFLRMFPCYLYNTKAPVLSWVRKHYHTQTIIITQYSLMSPFIPLTKWSERFSCCSYVLNLGTIFNLISSRKNMNKSYNKSTQCSQNVILECQKNIISKLSHHLRKKTSPKINTLLFVCVIGPRFHSDIHTTFHSHSHSISISISVLLIPFLLWLVQAGSCGGFVRTYKAICDYLNLPPRQDICWDVDNILHFGAIRDFNLVDYFYSKVRIFIQKLGRRNSCPFIQDLFLKHFSSFLKHIVESESMIFEFPLNHFCLVLGFYSNHRIKTVGESFGT